MGHFKNNSVHIIEVGDESDTDSDSDEHNLLTTPRAKKNGTMNQFETEYEEVVLPMERASTTGITDKISSVISKKKRDKSKKKKSRKRSKSKNKKKKRKREKKKLKKKKKGVFLKKKKNFI